MAPRILSATFLSHPVIVLSNFNNCCRRESLNHHWHCQHVKEGDQSAELASRWINKDQISLIVPSVFQNPLDGDFLWLDIPFDVPSGVENHFLETFTTWYSFLDRKFFVGFIHIPFGINIPPNSKTLMTEFQIHVHRVL